MSILRFKKLAPLFAVIGAAQIASIASAAALPKIMTVSADNRGLVRLRANCPLDETTINAGSVRVFTAGVDGEFRTGDDTLVARTITYIESTNEIRILATITADERYQVFVNASIVRGESGEFLDGEFIGVGIPSGDGVAGGDFEIFTRAGARPIARFSIDDRDIDVELFPFETPITVNNFLAYANAGEWDGTFFHRSVNNFIIQAGGFRANATFDEIDGLPAILNEPGISNLRGTIAMAKIGSNPNSATNQWFFNLSNNSTNLDAQNGGFTVFGEIVDQKGLTTMDLIANFTRVDASSINSAFTDLPVNSLQDFVDRGSVLAPEDLVEIERVAILQEFTAEPVITFNMDNAVVVESPNGDAEVMVFDVNGAPIPTDSVTVGFYGGGDSVRSVTLTNSMPNSCDIAVSIMSSQPVSSISDRRRGTPADIM